MSFTSEVYTEEPIIGDDAISHLVTHPDGVSRGLELGLRGPGDYEYGATATPFPDEWLIPETEWQARIQEMEETKTRVSDLIRLAKLPHKDQDRTLYCWINAPVHTLEITRLQQGQPTVILSPASVGAKVKNFQNVGGWGKEGLEYIVDHGVCPVDIWPANAINREYDTPAAEQVRARYRATEWTELRPRNRQQLISMLLRRITVAVGYNWWGHEVVACDAVWQDGTVATRIRNSWKNWGDFGFGILKGTKQDADDAVAPRVAVAA